jgi:hypothetical protein
MITMTQAELANLLEGVANKFEKRIEAFEKGAPSTGNDMKEFAAQIAESLSPNSGQRYAAKYEDQIDKKDFLDKPVKMFAYNHYFAIFGDVRYGHETKTPYGRPIQFTNVVTQKTSGKQVLYVAEANITTKKELEYMRSSPMYGIIFHEKIKADLTESDRVMAKMLSNAFMEISNMSEYQIMQRAKEEGLKASTDIELMRVSIIKKIAERNMAFEQSVSREATSLGIQNDKDFEDTVKRGKPHAGTSVMSY